MKNIYFLLGYTFLFFIGFLLLRNAHILDVNTNLREESISKFIIMMIFIIAFVKWSMKLFLWFLSLKDK